MAVVYFGPDFVDAVVAYGQGRIHPEQVRAWTESNALDDFLKSEGRKDRSLAGHFFSLVHVDLEQVGAPMMAYDPDLTFAPQNLNSMTQAAFGRDMH